MKLVSPHDSRERILSYGGFGTGKTFDYFDILKHTPDDVMLRVIDTDQTVAPFLESDEFAPYAHRVEYFEPFGWADGVEAVEKFTDASEPDDWLAVDLSDFFWDAVQDYFTEQVFGQSSDEMWLQYRAATQEEKDGKGAPTPFDGLKDWTVIKKVYRKFTMRLVRAECHIFLTAREKELIEHFENSETMRKYGGEGYKPAGEKSMGHIVRTVIRKKGGSGSPWRMTTIKDRQRELVKGQKVDSFAKNYLLAIAGWTPA